MKIQTILNKRLFSNKFELPVLITTRFLTTTVPNLPSIKYPCLHDPLHCNKSIFITSKIQKIEDMTFETEVSTAETRVVELADVKNPTGKTWSKIAEKDGAIVVR